MAETTLTAVDACRSIRSLPGGKPIPSGLAHALLVLATYYPNIWPGQERLAADMSVSRRSVNRRLRALEDAGLIFRYQRDGASTVYRLRLGTIRKCRRVVTLASQEDQTNDAPTVSVDWDGDEVGWLI